MALTGREVLTIHASEDFPRNTEGAFALLNDGSILYAFSRFIGGSDDDSKAEIYSYTSYDDGETWENGRVLKAMDDEDINIMSVSFLRMNDGALGMFYLRKFKEGENENCTPYLIRSYDEGKTWSTPERCVKEDGYFVMNNDRVIRLKSGHVLIPTSYHPNLQSRATSCFFVSDDDCKTFRKTKGELELPFFDKVAGMQETGAVELKDGKIWAFARTAHGFQFEAISEDEGETWSDVRPNPFFTSPLSPMGAKWINNGKLLAVFNPIPVFNGRFSMEGAKSPHALSNNTRKSMYHTFNTYGGRTPLTCAVSDNGPHDFLPLLKNLEDDPDLGFCYPAILSNKDYVLIAYFFGYIKEGKAYYDGRIKKLSLDDLTGIE